MTKFSSYWRASHDTTFTNCEHNTTLISRINEMSAVIHRNTRGGGANIIEISSDLLDIFYGFDHLDVTNMVFGGRYKVIVNDRWCCRIRMYHDKYPLVEGEIKVFDLPEPVIQVIKTEKLKIINKYKYLLIR